MSANNPSPSMANTQPQQKTTAPANPASQQPIPQSQPSIVPYIGSTISLISKIGIRYEGTLYNIDSKNSSVALSEVRMFGTEGRREDVNIPALDKVFDFISFKGSDISDLTVCEPPKSNHQPPNPMLHAQQYSPIPVNPAAMHHPLNFSSGEEQPNMRAQHMHMGYPPPHQPLYGQFSGQMSPYMMAPHMPYGYFPSAPPSGMMHQHFYPSSNMQQPPPPPLGSVAQQPPLAQQASVAQQPTSPAAAAAQSQQPQQPLQVEPRPRVSENATRAQPTKASAPTAVGSAPSISLTQLAATQKQVIPSQQAPPPIVAQHDVTPTGQGEPQVALASKEETPKEENFEETRHLQQQPHRGRRGQQYRRGSNSQYYRGNNNARGGKATSVNKEEELKGDFDFESANAKFDKLAIAKEMGDDSEQQGNNKSIYDSKQSFFDNISRESQQREKGRTREDRDEQFKTDKETFGDLASRSTLNHQYSRGSHHYHRRGPRGGSHYRGGYGRGTRGAGNRRGWQGNHTEKEEKQ